MHPKQNFEFSQEEELCKQGHNVRKMFAALINAFKVLCLFLSNYDSTGVL